MYKCVCSTALPGTELITTHAICVDACESVLRIAVLRWHLRSVPCMVEPGGDGALDAAQPWLYCS